MKGYSSFLLSIIFLVIIILGVVQVFVSNKLSTAGVTLVSLRKNLSLYKQENEFLRMELAKTGSLTNIATRAAEKGFIKDTSPLVLVPGARFALK